MNVGDRASLERAVTPEDVRAFAEVTGDSNPVHLDAAFASRTQFGRPIAHGMLCGSLISAVLGTRLPGPGAIYLRQTLKFVAPSYVGEAVVVEVVVTGIREDRPIITLSTVCRRKDGTVLVEGEAVMLQEVAGLE